MGQMAVHVPAKRISKWLSRINFPLAPWSSKSRAGLWGSTSEHFLAQSVGCGPFPPAVQTIRKMQKADAKECDKDGKSGGEA